MAANSSSRQDQPSSETTPLLPKPNAGTSVIDPGGVLAPAGIQPEDGGDVERQVSHGDSFKHHGLPEVRKRMKYIFPAIAIGVSSQRSSA